MLTTLWFVCAGLFIAHSIWHSHQQDISYCLDKNLEAIKWASQYGTIAEQHEIQNDDHCSHLDIPGLNRSEGWIVTGLVVGPPVMTWILVIVLVFAVRWILRGFNTPKANET